VQDAKDVAAETKSNFKGQLSSFLADNLMKIIGAVMALVVAVPTVEATVGIPLVEIPYVSEEKEDERLVLPPGQLRNTDPHTLARDISGAEGLVQVGFEDAAARAKTTSVTGITIGDSVNKIYTESRHPPRLSNP